VAPRPHRALHRPHPGRGGPRPRPQAAAPGRPGARHLRHLGGPHRPAHRRGPRPRRREAPAPRRHRGEQDLARRGRRAPRRLDLPLAPPPRAQGQRPRQPRPGGDHPRPRPARHLELPQLLTPRQHLRLGGARRHLRPQPLLLKLQVLQRAGLLRPLPRHRARRLRGGPPLPPPAAHLPDPERRRLLHGRHPGLRPGHRVARPHPRQVWPRALGGVQTRLHLLAARHGRVHQRPVDSDVVGPRLQRLPGLGGLRRAPGERRARRIREALGLHRPHLAEPRRRRDLVGLWRPHGSVSGHLSVHHLQRPLAHLHLGLWPRRLCRRADHVRGPAQAGPARLGGRRRGRRRGLPLVPGGVALRPGR
jgi:hypothetical protein